MKKLTWNELDEACKSLPEIFRYEQSYIEQCLTNKVKPTKQGLKDFHKVEAKKFLLSILKPSSVVYTVLRHVSTSGMSRNISVLFSNDDGIHNLDFYVARLLDAQRAKDGSIKVNGCGMDMGFHLVYSLSRALFNSGYKCTGKSCRSNDHSNAPHPKRKRGSMTHADGGYCLNHRWL